MKRREFIALVGGAAAWPLAARAQQAGKVWRIGILTGASPSDFSELGAAFVQGMRELGYVEGRDFVLETRSVEGKYERFPEVASEFVRLNVDVIVTATTAAIRTLQRATTTIPIVLANSTDPVATATWRASLAPRHYFVRFWCEADN
jgi:putative ABC transport system substrate-binding protein